MEPIGRIGIAEDLIEQARIAAAVPAAAIPGLLGRRSMPIATGVTSP